jgi:hypothetical protein
VTDEPADAPLTENAIVRPLTDDPNSSTRAARRTPPVL